VPINNLNPLSGQDYINQRDLAVPQVKSQESTDLLSVANCRVEILVKTSDDTFVVRLSDSDAERRRNLILLRSMPWLDISIAYRNQHRAVLSIEKGLPGSAAFLAVLEVLRTKLSAGELRAR
jgi:hypothetical protein